MFVWVELNGKQTYVDDEELDPCELCGAFIGTCRLSGCVEEEDAGCFWCGSRTNGACRCDNAYESQAGK